MYFFFNYLCASKLEELERHKLVGFSGNEVSNTIVRWRDRGELGEWREGRRKEVGTGRQEACRQSQEEIYGSSEGGRGVPLLL